MTDVIQQAREALAHMEAAWEDDDVPLTSDFQAIHNLIAEIDAGHLIDTRRMDALAEKGIAIIPEGRSKMHKWEVWHGEIAATAPTFADALAAAEREANQRGEPRDLMAALKKSLGIPDDAEREVR